MLSLQFAATRTLGENLLDHKIIYKMQKNALPG